LAVLIAFVWLGEVPLLKEVLGGLVVIIGVVTISHGDRLWALLRRRKFHPMKGSAAIAPRPYRPARIDRARAARRDW
jgi:hypothetical protein